MITVYKNNIKKEFRKLGIPKGQKRIIRLSQLEDISLKKLPSKIKLKEIVSILNSKKKVKKKIKSNNRFVNGLKKTLL